MTKKQFLEGLYQGLIGAFNKEEIYSHIQYYDEYIENEKIKGVSEEEVIKQLGNPRLLAKTIIDSANKGNNTYTSYSQSEQSGKQPEEKKKSSVGKRIKIALIVFVVLFILFQLIKVGFLIFWKIGLPIIIVVFVVRQILKIFK